jgi:hypothetical protein
LASQDRGFFLIEQGKERDVLQYFRVAGHGIPRRVRSRSIFNRMRISQNENFTKRAGEQYSGDGKPTAIRVKVNGT